MCDDDCTAIFTKKFLHILKDDRIILQGYRNLLDGLWDIPLLSSKNVPSINTIKNNALNFIVHKNKTDHEIAQYIQGCLFSAPASAIQRAIKNGNLIGFPAIQYYYLISLSTTLSV